MSDPARSFESQLERMFAQTPHFPDAPLFAARVQDRLERDWALRRGLIAALGAGGGVAVVAQVVMATIGRQAGAVGQAAASSVAASVGRLLQPWRPQIDALGTLPFGDDLLWAALGALALGAGLLLSRAVDRV